MSHLTLNEHISQDGYTLPAVLDDATKELIISWFGTREIIFHFNEYFERQCNLHYPYYKQLLRIDPTVAKYDWFVTQYLERETTGKTSGIDTNSGTRDTTGSQNSTGANSQTVQLNGSVTNSGKDTTSVNDTKTDSKTTSGTTSGSNSKDTTGSQTGETTEADTTKNTSITSGVSASITDDISRQAPMSAEYTSLLSGDGKLTSKLTDEITLSIDNMREGTVYPNILNPTATSSSINNSNDARGTSTDGSINKGGTSSLNTTGKETGSSSGETSGTESGSYTDIGTTEVAHGHVVTTADTTTTTGETSGNTQTTGKQTDDFTQTTDRDTTGHEQSTGRSQSIQDLIQAAKGVIISSESWVWLRDKLEKCFIQVWNIDTDNELDETTGAAYE